MSSTPSLNAADIILMSIAAVFVLLTCILIITILWSSFCSRNASRKNNIMKFCSLCSGISALIIVSIDMISIVFTIQDIHYSFDAVVTAYVLPLIAFLLKLFVTILFLAQFEVLRDSDIIYKSSQSVVTLIYILMAISIGFVVTIIVLEILIALHSNAKTSTISKVYFWTFIGLNINELALSITVIYVFWSKLVMSFKFERFKSSTIDIEDQRRRTFVGQDSIRMSQMNVNMVNDWISRDRLEYGIPDERPQSAKETQTVHIMVRVAMLSIGCIVWTEMLFITLLNERLIPIDLNGNEMVFEVRRCIEAFCVMMAMLCIYLHFASSFAVYDVLCKCCHAACFKGCAKCVTGGNQKYIMGLWADDIERDNSYIQMGRM